MIDTHYIYRPKILDSGEFRDFVSDVRAIVAQKPSTLRLCGMDGLSDPVITEGVVVLNGDRRRGLEHETLVIEQTATLSRERDGVHFEFCKTNGKPYDVVVVAVLYAFLQHFPQCKFVSDSKIDELKPGFDLFFNACQPRAEVGRLYHRPVDERD